MAVGSSWSWKPPRGDSAVELNSAGKRAESGYDPLREPFGGVGVGGARSFVRISSRSLGSSSSRKAEKRASPLRCTS